MVSDSVASQSAPQAQTHSQGHRLDRPSCSARVTGQRSQIPMRLVDLFRANPNSCSKLYVTLSLSIEVDRQTDRHTGGRDSGVRNVHVASSYTVLWLLAGACTHSYSRESYSAFGSFDSLIKSEHVESLRWLPSNNAGQQASQCESFWAQPWPTGQGFGL